MDSGPSLPPPPPPPLPGSMGAIHIPTYKEQQMKQQTNNNNVNNANDNQYANLPPQLMSTLNKDKKPFTYTPNSLIGEKGLLDLSQIKSPRMKKRLMENQKDDEQQQPQYFPVSPPRKLNILQEVKEQQQYQPEQQHKQHYSPVSPPLPSPPPPLQQQQSFSPQVMQQEPSFPSPPPPLRNFERQQSATINSPQICSTPTFTNLNQQPKPFQRQNEDWFPQYSQQQQYFNIAPPKKIDIYKEIQEQPTLPKTPVYAPTLQEQWQQRKQQQQHSPPAFQQRQTPVQSPVKQYSQQQPPFYDYGEQQSPVQSKSFKVLQHMINTNEDQQPQQQVPWRPQYEEEPAVRRSIPSNTFRYLQTKVGITDEEAMQQQQQRQRIIPIQIERQNSQGQRYVPPSLQERIKTPPTYQGASIPSRSFRLLQIMTDDDQQQYMQQQRIPTSGFEGTDF